MPPLNMSVQRLKVAILPLDLTCSGPVTHSREILTTGKSHGKKPDRFSSARYVHQMAIYVVSNIFFFFNHPSELTFWITYVVEEDVPELELQCDHL